MDYQTYPTRQAAGTQAAKSRETGWPDAAAILLCLPDDENANPNGNAWVVRCERNGDQGTFIREDGYVR